MGTGPATCASSNLRAVNWLIGCGPQTAPPARSRFEIGPHTKTERARPASYRRVLAAQTGATLAELMGRFGHSTPGAAMRYRHAGIARRLSELAKPS